MCADRNTKIRSSQFQDDSLQQSDLDLTTTPTNGQFIKINMPTGDFTPTDAVSPTFIEDADGDTKVQTEESADEDIIRFDTATLERMTINASGLVSIGGGTPGTVAGTGDLYITDGLEVDGISYFDNKLEISAVSDHIKLYDSDSLDANDFWKFNHNNNQLDISFWDNSAAGWTNRLRLNTVAEGIGINITPITGVQLLLPSENDAVTPTLAFGDGDSGFYESSDDIIACEASFLEGNGSGRPSIRFGSASTSISPGFLFNGDSNTGIGRAGADQLSLISGGVEQARLNVTGNHIINSAIDAATGNEIALSLNYTVNKLTSGNDTGLLISMTDTLSPGTSLPLDIQVDASSILSINSIGNLTLLNGTGINEFSIDGTLVGNSDDAVPTEKAVKTYVDTQDAILPTDLNISLQTVEDFLIFNGTNWVAKGGSELRKVQAFTRDMSLASGTQAIAGVGFRPSAIVFFASQDGTSKTSWGWADITGQQRALSDEHAGTANSYQIIDSKAISVLQSATIGYNASVTFDADGFTLTWTKVGAATGILDITYFAFR